MIILPRTYATVPIASVKAEDFTVGKVGDAADLIKGKVAGLSIAKGSGDPNATSAIRLRGVISVNGSTFDSDRWSGRRFKYSRS